MDKEIYMFQLQQEYLDKSKVYMNAIAVGRPGAELNAMALELRCLLTEIKALKEDIARSQKGG